MRLKSLFFNVLSNRNQISMPVLVVPGAGLVGLGLLVWVLKDIVVFLISSALVLIGLAMLFFAFRMRLQGTNMGPQPLPTKKPRIRVVESDDP
jgi:hypothetical protein